MKVKELVNRMNDHGTRPRVNIILHTSDYSQLIYEGRPDGVSKVDAEYKVESFTVRGIGFLEIHVR